MEYTKKIYVFFILVAVVVVLIYAQSIILPFVISLILWYMIRVLKQMLIKIRYIKELPNWLLSMVSSVLLFGFLFLVVGLIMQNIMQLSETLPVYESNVREITHSINQKFNIDLGTLAGKYANKLEFTKLLSGLLSAFTSIFSNAFTILLYLIFILFEERIFTFKIKAMYPDSKQFSHVDSLIKKIDYSTQRYVSMKTVISLTTGFASYLVLLLIGVDVPVFWAFLIFIFNYIPTIGSIIATFFPAIFALLQFGEFGPAIIVLLLVGFIQVIVGNFIEPKVMGNTLNISPLVVLLALTLWGAIWGITGMLLSVPITVILIIIMSEIPSTRPLAILLSEKGEIDK
jgi:predicted PurR-regulated permease PerM